jgi:hypothetical protein
LARPRLAFGACCPSGLGLRKKAGARNGASTRSWSSALPLDHLYFALKSLSRNGGAVDYERLVEGGDIFPVARPEAAFTLFRIGDAVAARNIHAAIHDGIRFALRI